MRLHSYLYSISYAITLLVLSACQGGFDSGPGSAPVSTGFEQPSDPAPSPLNPVTHNWVTVRDFQLHSGKDSGATGLFIDKNGNVFVSGFAADALSNHHWIVEKSSDGVTWNRVDDFQAYAGFSSYPVPSFHMNPFTQLSTGELFIHGFAKDSVSYYHQVVRKSSDSGNTWNTVDNYLYPTGSGIESLPVLTDPSGPLYHISGIWTPDNKFRVITRKSTDKGNTWSDKAEYMFTGAKETLPVAAQITPSGAIVVALKVLGPETNINNQLLTSVAVIKSTDGASTWVLQNRFIYQTDRDTHVQNLAQAPDGTLYLTGYGMSAFGHNSLIRKSNDEGSTWTTVDDFTYSSNNLTRSFISQFDALGNVFVSVSGIDENGKNHWLLRKSSLGGGAWNSVGDYTESGGIGVHSMAVYIDKSGRLFIVGSAESSDGSNRWIVRMSSDQGQTWTTIDDFQYAAGKDSVAKQILVSPNGTVYVLGDAQDAQLKYHWIVRSLTEL